MSLIDISSPSLKKRFLPPSTDVDPQWASDASLRYWLNMRPPKDETFTGQFLDDMDEFIRGLDNYNWDRPTDKQVTLLVGRETEEKIAARDMKGIGSVRITNQFAIKYRNQIHEGEFFCDRVVMVYGIWFNPHRIFNNQGAFYFGYNPPRDFGQYMDWLVTRNPFQFKRPEPA